VSRGGDSQESHAQVSAENDNNGSHGAKAGGTSAAERRSLIARIPTWAKFLVGAFVTALVGALVTQFYPDLVALFSSTATPVRFTISEVVGPGYSITVPDQEALQPLLGSINSCDALHSAADAAGGVNDYGLNMNILAQGTASSGVTITNMQTEIVGRGAPLTGALVFCQSAGTEEAMSLNFNLNGNSSNPTGPLGNNGKPTKSFFANGSVIHLDDNEVYPFHVGASISGGAVKWVIKATVLVNGQQSVVTIDNHGKPFETTSELPVQDYGDLYEYDWGIEHRLLHYRSTARNPDDCSADLAMKAIMAFPGSNPGQVLTIDCAGSLVHVEEWVPSTRCFAHYLGFHTKSHWTLFAMRSVCGDDELGALFSEETIRHAGGNPQAFANAFGSSLVSSGAIPANPGPYDNVPRLSVGQLAARAGCTTLNSLSGKGRAAGATATAVCTQPDSGYVLLTFASPARRNEFAYSQFDRKPGVTSIVGTRSLVVAGPTWLIYGHVTYSGDEPYVGGQTEQQFAQAVGGEAGMYAYTAAPEVFGNKAPTIANGLL
jgi:hypothetical protein